MRKTHMCEISVSQLRWAASTSRAQSGSDGQLTKTFLLNKNYFLPKII